MTTVDVPSSNAPPVSPAGRVEDAPAAGGGTISLGLQVETPENVVLTYQLAGPAVRCAAYLIDTLIRAMLLLVAAVVLQIFGTVLPGSALGLFLIVLFLMEWGYFVACEGLMNGRTPGKAAMGLRVIHEGGYPLTLWGSMGRNLLRFADALPVFGWLVAGLPLYGVGLVTVVLSPRLQRLGDLVAETVVISERHVVLPREPVILEKIDPLPREEINTWGPPARTLSAIDRFLGRRHILSHTRGHAIARDLARVLARRLEYTGDARQIEHYPMAFLARVHVTFLRREPPELPAIADGDRWAFDVETSDAI